MGFQHMHPILRKAAQSKGGRWKLKKGFGTNPELARKAGSKGGTNKKLNSSTRSKNAIEGEVGE